MPARADRLDDRGYLSDTGVVGLIGLYVIIKRPRWFLDVTKRLYDEGNKSTASAEEEI